MITNPFDTDAFSVVELTNAINVLPNNYGRLRRMNLMPVQGVRTRTVMIEEKNGVLNLIPSQPVGAPGTPNKTGSRKARTFAVPHLPLDGVILPDEYDGIRAFGSEDAMAELASIMNDHLQGLKDKHAITLEWLRMGALKGLILNADGTTMYDLFNEFEVTQKTVNFALGTDATDVRGKCFDVLRHIEDNLQGEVYTGVHCLCSSTFMDKLINHPNVYDTFLYQSSERLREDVRKAFDFGGIRFEEYRGQATDIEDNTRQFIADGEAHFFPRGTRNTFSTYAAPADFMEAVNTRGKLFYAKQEPRKYNRGVDIHTQSNPLPICRRPALLVKGTDT